MITSMHIENFKCFKDFDIELGKFNVLVGPNDSGKTAFLQAVQLATAFSEESRIPASLLEEQLGTKLGKEAFWRNQTRPPIVIIANCPESESKNNNRKGPLKVYSEGPEKFLYRLENEAADGRLFVELTDNDVEWAFSEIGRSAYYQFEPNALRKPSRISAKMKETGEGFPAFLAKISLESREVFFDLEKKFYSRFPYYKRLEPKITKIENDQDAFCLRFHTVRGEELSSESVSDGVMLSLAFIALAYSLEPPKILLIEEPENGVHHASLKEIISTLRELSENKRVQIILTTHSPYLLDLVEPEEVRVFAKNKEGAVHAAKLSDHPEVEDLKKHFMTGEIWSGLDDAKVVEKCGGKK
ncbi:MAG: AAA family ATPase [Planctomycetota bacterium]|nr:AAA family ATPase [Planctomycetota bacterium]